MSSPRYCEICRQPIEAERADALRDTRLCAQHGREIAAFGRGVVTAAQERTSKAGSLKKNCGGVATSQRRNQTAIDRTRDAFLAARRGELESWLRGTRLGSARSPVSSRIGRA